MSLYRTYSAACVLVVFMFGNLSAAPVLTVSPQSVNGSGNWEWLVRVASDPALGSGSLAVELAFEITGSNLVNATKNAADWAFDNPGNNPFTGTVTFGTQTDPIGGTVFSSLGGGPFPAGDFIDTLTIETLGAGPTTVSWGGHTLLPGTPNEYTGSRISQAGTNFDGYVGSVSVPESSTPYIPLVLFSLGTLVSRKQTVRKRKGAKACRTIKRSISC